MTLYRSLCDDFYVNLNLSTEMDLPSNRETILHFFDRIQKAYPSMQNFYARDSQSFVLEEDKTQGNYRWCAVEPRRICSGYVNPDSLDACLRQHELVLELAPFHLSVNRLDCETLDLLFGFDFTYRGNHNELIAEALGTNPALESFADTPGSSLISHEPTVTIALDAECRRQVRVSIETRSSAYHIRTGEFPEEQLSVYVTVRQYGSLGGDADYVTVFQDLSRLCTDVVDQHVTRNILQPLARTIALK